MTTLPGGTVAGVVGTEMIGLGPAQWPLVVRDGVLLGERRTELRVAVPAGVPVAVVSAVLRQFEALRFSVVSVPGLSVPVLVDQGGSGVTVTGSNTGVVASFPSACVDAPSLALLGEALGRAFTGFTAQEEALAFGDVLEWQRESAELALPGSVTTSFGALLAAVTDVHEKPRYEWAECPGLVAGWVGDESVVDAVALALRSCLDATDEPITVLRTLPGRVIEDLRAVVGRLDLLAPLRLPPGVVSSGAAREALATARTEATEAFVADPLGFGASVAVALGRAITHGEFLVGAVAAPDLGRSPAGYEVVDHDPGIGDLVAVVDLTSGDVRLRADRDRVRVGAAIVAERLRSQLARVADDDEPLLRPAPVGQIEAECQREVLTAVPRSGPATTVVQLVWDAVRATPDANALVGEDGEPLSYGALGLRASATADLLATAGTRRGDLVAVHVSSLVDLVVGGLAVNLLGAAYVPVDDEGVVRAEAALSRAGLRAVLSARPEADRMGDAPVIGLAGEGTALREPPAVSADELVYGILTSGTTGRPNLVGVTHAGLTSYVEDAVRTLHVGRETVAASPAALVTDLALTAVWPVLGCGGTVVAVPSRARTDGPSFAGLIRAQAVTLVKATPSHLAALLDADGTVLPTTTLVLGGEQLPRSLVVQVREARPNLKVVNHYGPTETTVGVVAGVPDDGSTTTPLGTVMPSVTASVVDDAGAPVPFDHVGELVVHGDRVARGYLGDPRLTAERFVPSVTGGGRRAFRTGDRAAAAADGTLTFHGRADRQVKVRGWRVELAEVEAALLGDPRVRQAGVVVDRDGAALVGFVVAEPDLDVEDTLGRLHDRLPAAMVPARLHVVASLPLSPNGKMDRAALEAVHLESAAVAVPPRNDLERLLAGIWSELVGLVEVDVKTDVFTLGVHSLLAMQAASRLRQLLQVDVSAGLFYDHPTIAGLAEHLATLPDAGRLQRRASIVVHVAQLSDEQVADAQSDLQEGPVE